MKKHYSNFLDIEGMELSTFDKVLVRETSKDYWQPAFIEFTIPREEGGTYYYTLSESKAYTQCLKYEGYEYLAGKRNDPSNRCPNCSCRQYQVFLNEETSQWQAICHKCGCRGPNYDGPIDAEVYGFRKEMSCGAEV